MLDQIGRDPVEGPWDADRWDRQKQAALDRRVVAEYEAEADRATAAATGPEAAAAEHAATRAELETMIGAPLGPLMRAPGDIPSYSIEIGGRVQQLGTRGVTSFATFKGAVAGATDRTLPDAVRRNWSRKYEPALQATVRTARSARPRSATLAGATR